jgi:hypothetical protein
MACTLYKIDEFRSMVSSITGSCNTAFGGLKKVEFYEKGTEGTAEEPLFILDFNIYDGYTNFVEEKTASLDGAVECVQTLSVEVPKASNASKVMTFANPNQKFSVKIYNKKDQIILMGKEYGASLKTSNVSSGAQRMDKDAIQLTFEAREINLSTEITKLVDETMAVSELEPAELKQVEITDTTISVSFPKAAVSKAFKWDNAKGSTLTANNVNSDTSKKVKSIAMKIADINEVNGFILVSLLVAPDSLTMGNSMYSPIFVSGVEQTWLYNNTEIAVFSSGVGLKIND